MTPTQENAYSKLSLTTPQCSYELGHRLPTLRALVKQGRAVQLPSNGIGAQFSPTTHYRFLKAPGVKK